MVKYAGYKDNRKLMEDIPNKIREPHRVYFT